MEFIYIFTHANKTGRTVTSSSVKSSIMGAAKQDASKNRVDFPRTNQCPQTFFALVLQTTLTDKIK